MLIGTDGVYSYTFEYEKRADCPVCGGEAIDLAISPDLMVEDLINMLVEKQDMCVRPVVLSTLKMSYRCFCFFSQIKKPSLSAPNKQIYLQAPPQLEEATRPNLAKKVSELVPPGGEVTVTASTLPFSLSLRIVYT